MRFHQNILILRNEIFQVYDLLGHPGGEKEKGGGPNEVFITRKSEIIFKVRFLQYIPTKKEISHNKILEIWRVETLSSQIVVVVHCIKMSKTIMKYKLYMNASNSCGSILYQNE